MPERARIGALDHLGLAARAVEQPGEAGVWLGERRFQTMVNVRASATDVLAVALPTQANTSLSSGGTTALWLGPDEWLVLGSDDLDASLENNSEMAASFTDVSEARTTIVVSGPRARDVLAKGCPLDLHPRAFPSGACAQSLVGPVNVILHRTDVDGDEHARFELLVLRSFADYLWRFLEDAGQEYGVAVVELPSTPG